MLRVRTSGLVPSQPSSLSNVYAVLLVNPALLKTRFPAHPKPRFCSFVHPRYSLACSVRATRGGRGVMDATSEESHRPRVTTRRFGGKVVAIEQFEIDARRVVGRIGGDVGRVRQRRIDHVGQRRWAACRPVRAALQAIRAARVVRGARAICQDADTRSSATLHPATCCEAHGYAHGCGARSGRAAHQAIADRRRTAPPSRIVR
jgi:hypothetical protein